MRMIGNGSLRDDSVFPQVYLTLLFVVVPLLKILDKNISVTLAISVNSPRHPLHQQNRRTLYGGKARFPLSELLRLEDSLPLIP